MRIKFINHACVLLMYEQINLLCDPWITGDSCHNSWRHIAPSGFSKEDLATVTHIWLSGEPFALEKIKKINNELYPKITLILPTKISLDIEQLCRALGFKAVLKTEKNEWLPLEANFKIKSETVSGQPAWLYATTPHTKLLHLVCNNLSEEIYKEIAQTTGGVDVLMSSFSYNYWAGNSEQKDLRKQIAKNCFADLKLKCEVFKPRFCAPVSSFIAFAHEENAYLNDSLNTAEDVYEFINRYIKTEPLLLFPNDLYWLSSNHDSLSALTRWEKVYEETLSNLTLHKSGDLLFETLQLLWESRRKTPLVPHEISHIAVFISNIQKSVEISWEKGMQFVPNLSRENCLIALSSEALSICLREVYGVAWLWSSGRFQEIQTNGFEQVSHFFDTPVPKEFNMIEALLQQFKKRFKW